MRWIAAMLVGVLMAAPGLNASPPTREARIAAARGRVCTYLAEHALAWGIRDTADLREVKAQVIFGDAVVFRYQQFFDGVPVHNAQLILTAYRTSIAVTNGLVNVLNVDTKPEINEQQAITIASAQRKLHRRPDDVSAQLLILPAGSKATSDEPAWDRLAWHVSMTIDNAEDGFDERSVFVDAHTGQVIDDYSEIQHLTYYLGGPSMRGMYASRRQFSLFGPVDKQFRMRYVLMRDPCYGTGLPVAGYTQYVSNGPDSRLCGHPEPGPQNLMGWSPDGEGNWVGDSGGKYTTSGSPLKLDGGVSDVGTGMLGATDALTQASDAFIGIYLTFRYLELVHTLEGLDGSNGPVVRGLVRQGMNSASWSSKSNAIQMGTRTGGYPMASLDVIAHELGHGLSAFGPRLDGRNPETGAISESTADIFAMVVSDYFSFDHDAVPWWIAEQTFPANYSAGQILNPPVVAERYMDDPSRIAGNPVCYSPTIGNLDPHRGAGPGDHMFYLLAYGGVSVCDGSVVSGVGVSAAQSIWMAAFSSLKPSSRYADLRVAFVTASTNLFPGPSPVTASVVDAFDAVNIP
jgi:Zn-dependent metalloprotease